MPQAEIAEAGNGVQAMALLEKESFDILFVDIHLGDMEADTGWVKGLENIVVHPQLKSGHRIFRICGSKDDLCLPTAFIRPAWCS